MINHIKYSASFLWVVLVRVPMSREMAPAWMRYIDLGLILLELAREGKIYGETIRRDLDTYILACVHMRPSNGNPNWNDVDGSWSCSVK
jgi:hypothetical protein